MVARLSPPTDSALAPLGDPHPRRSATWPRRRRRTAPGCGVSHFWQLMDDEFGLPTPDPGPGPRGRRPRQPRTAGALERRDAARGVARACRDMDVPQERWLAGPPPSRAPGAVGRRARPGRPVSAVVDSVRGVDPGRRRADQARGLSKAFGDFAAVDGIDVDVRRGRGVRLPRPQRRRQVLDDADDRLRVAVDRRRAAHPRPRPRDATARRSGPGSASARRRTPSTTSSTSGEPAGSTAATSACPGREVARAGRRAARVRPAHRAGRAPRSSRCPAA